jgi:antitoxin (DNA-binding transcriptional repressor) of toxin-antitoxin stability system
MATIRISADEAARDFAALLARVRAGAEVVIDDDASPSVVMRAAAAPYGRSISESIALAEAHAREAGSEPMMDADFAADVEEVIRMRKPRDTSAWD